MLLYMRIMTSKKILIIDDDVAILEVMKIILEDKGYHVITTPTGDNIEEKVQDLSPNIILLDFWLAGIDGHYIAKQLKSKVSTKHIPVIMVSANHDPKKIAIEVGADDFLEKPFDIDDLVNIVEKHTS